MRELMSMSSIWTIARYSFLGYIRERVLLVVIAFGGILMLSSYVLAPLAVGAQAKIIVDIGLASISVFGVLLVILLGAGSFSREKDKGILPNLLAKPITRLDFMLGKYFGTLAIIGVVMFIMAGVYIAVMLLGSSSLTSTMFLAMYLSLIEVAVLIAVMTFFSSFTGPLLASFFTLCIFVVGHASEDLLSFAEQFGGAAMKIVTKICYYALPNLALFNVRSEAVHSLPLMDNYVFTVSLYAMCFILLLLLFSHINHSRRDVT